MLFVACLLGTPPARAQLPALALQGLPATPLIGEAFCVDASFSNTETTTGYGPYLLAVVDPGIARLSVSFVDIPPRLEKIGDFDASGELTDPLTGTPVTGTPGGSAWIARFPVGSVDQTGPALVMEVCAVVEAGTEIGVPLDVAVTPGFEFGDTTVGTNGPIVGATVSETVTPLLARVTKSNTAPEGERPPGPSHVFQYSWRVDISEGVSIDNVIAEDVLPPQIQWSGGPISISAPLGQGCSLATSPDADVIPGATVTVTCASVLGAAGDGDIVVEVPVYITDVLDEAAPDQQVITNTVLLDFDFQGSPEPQTSATSTVSAKHAAVQKSVSGTGLPGGLLTYAINFQLTDYPDGTPGAGASAFVVEDVVADGLRYDRTVALVVNATTYPITPIETPGPGPGQTTLTWDVATALPGGLLPNGARGSLTFETTILENYANGELVLAADGFSNTVQSQYTLTSGAVDGDSSSIEAAIQPSLTDKSILSPNPLPTALRPGDEVVFRLEQDVRAGSTADVVLTDFLPRPVFDVGDFNAAADLRVVAPGFTPPANPAVSTDPSANSVTLDFGDLTTDRFERLEVFLTVRVVSAPFADNLFLTNLLNTSYRNTAGDVISGLDAVGLTVGAPSLEITKGVLSADNPDARVTPAPPPDPSQATADSDVSGVDAFDEITYVVTVENVGSSPAFNVTIDEPAAAGLSCTEPVAGDAVDGNGRTLAFSGSLAAGLVLNDPLAANDGTPGAPYADDTALLTLRCTLAANVEPLQEVVNEAGVTWTSVADPSQPFTRVSDVATAVMAPPAVSKSVTGISPGYAGSRRAHIGELVTYQVEITVPEGVSSAARLEDLVPNGLAFVDVLSVTASPALSSSEGSFDADVLANAGFAAQGGGVTAADRRLLFGPGANDNGFGTITNTDRNNATPERITVVYRARVLNAAVNTAGQARSNRAAWSWQSTGSSRRSIVRRARAVRLVEADLRIDKTLSPDNGDNNTPPVVTIELSHATGSSADAFDVVLDDLLPADMFVDTSLGGVDTSGCAVPPDSISVTDETTSDRVEARWDTFPLGGTCTLTFPTRFPFPLPAGIQLRNCAETVWESLRDADQPLAQPPSSTLGVERDGSGSPPGQQNDYAVESCDTFNVFGVGIEKSVLATDQAHTDSIPGTPADTESLTIGEVVTFELVLTIPEVNVTGLEVTDLLPITDKALELLSARTTSVGADLSPTTPDPVAVIDNRDGDVDGDGNPIDDRAVLDYGFVGHVLNGITDEADRIRIEVVAKVRDELVNRNNDRTSNNALVRFLPGITASDSALLELVEPLVGISKTADRDEAEAGDLVQFTLRVEHDAASRIDAKDLTVRDLIPPELNVINASVDVGTVCTDDPDTGPVLAAGEISATWTSFPRGAVCEIDFQATVDVTAVIGQTIVNTADIAWTSLNGQGDPDDRQYARQDSWPITISEPGLDKEISATDVDATVGVAGSPTQELTIGETVTFTVTADFPDGTTEQAVLEDQLPTGDVALQITRAELVAVGADLTLGSGLAPGSVASDCSTGAPQSCASWDLGDVVNAPDVRPAPDVDDQLVFEVDAIVLDDPANSGAPDGDKQLQNTAVLSSLSTRRVATAIFDLVEPRLEISKLTENNRLPGIIAANTTHRFTLAIEHLPLSTATALDLVIEDTLDPQINWEDDGSVTSTCPVGQWRLVSSPGAGNTGTVRFAIDALTLAEGGCTISYEVRANALLTVPGRFPNLAVLAWESAPASAESRSGESTDDNFLVSVSTASVDKVVTGTSVPDTGDALGSDPPLDELTIGEQVSYRIVTAFSEGTSADATLTDTLQSGGAVLELVGGNVLFIGANLTTSEPGTPQVDLLDPSIVRVDYGTVENVGDAVLDADDTIVYELVARVVDVPANVDGEVLGNSIELTFAGGSESASVDVEVVEPELTIDKSFLDLTDGVATIAVELENTGTAPAYEVTVTDEFDEALWVAGSLVAIDVPARFTLTEASAAGVSTVTLATEGDPSRPEEVLLPGETLSLTFSYELQDGGVVGAASSTQIIENTATVTYTSLPGISPAERIYTADAVDSLRFAELALAKEWSGPSDPARPGDVLTYTLTLENTGAAPATGIELVDVPDPIGEFQPGSVVVSSGGTVVRGNGASDTDLLVSFSDLADGTSVTVEYSVRLPLPYPDSTRPERLTNQAAVESKELRELLSDDPSTGVESDATVVPIVADPVMVVSKDDQVVLTSPGSLVEYAITFGNVGDQIATGVELTETVPDDTRFSAADSSPGWSCADGSGPGTVCELAVGSLDLTPGTAFFSVRVDATLDAAVTEIRNTVAIADDGQENDPGAPVVPSTASDDEVTPIGGAFPQLQIDKDDGGIGVSPGQRYGYAIDYANIGNQAATGVVITETVPDDVLFSASASAPTRWSCPNGSPPGTVCSIVVPLLAAQTGDSVVFGLDVLFPAAAGRELIANRVEITDDGGNSAAPTTDSDIDNTPLIAAPDIFVMKTTDVGQTNVGRSVLYDVQFGNRGNQNATGVAVRERVPPGATFNAADSAPTNWSCPDGAAAGTVCEFLAGDVDVGAIALLQFAVDVIEAPNPRELRNVIEAGDDGSNGPDPQPSDNIAVVVTPFVALAIDTLSRGALLLLALLVLQAGMRQRRRAG